MPVTIRDIAEALGVSIGTVDRALNDRSGVNPMTKSRVLQMAANLGYRPNLAARFLSSKKRLRISINVPEQIATFWDAVREGIQNEAQQLASSGLDLEFRNFPKFGSGEEEVFNAALDGDVNGIIAATGRPQKLRPLIRKASRMRIPVVCVVTDAPGTERLAVVSIDSLVSGSLAGELLSRFVHGNGKVAMITGDLAVTDHAEKYSSFQSAIHSLFPNMQILEPIENHEDEIEAYEKANRLCKDHRDLKGLYVSTANSAPVLKALKDSGALHKVTVITTDLFPALVRYIESGAVIASIYQRPKSQGLMAFRLMHDFLVKGQCPSHRMKLAPHLVMKSNLAFFLERMPLDSELPQENLEASAG